MAITVTAAQGGSTAASLLLRVFVLTGAAATQNGASFNSQFASTTAFTGSITTTAGSNVYGAASHGSGVTDSGSNTTVVDSSDDTTNGWHYSTFKALNVTAGATTRGLTISLAQSGPLAMLEILASGTLAEDSSAPAAADGTGTAATSVTTASFTPPAGSLLVALVASDGGATVTTMTVSDTSGLTWTEKVKNNPSGGDYAGVWTAQVAAAGVTGAPQRYGQAAPPSPAPWEQRPYRSLPGAVDTPANPLVSPLDSAWQADAQYSHLYADDALRDRRQYFTQRTLASDPALLAGAAADPTLLAAQDTARRYGLPATHYDRRQVPAQKDRCDANTVATPANPLPSPLDSAWQAGGHYQQLYSTAAWWDRREVPQQRIPPPDQGQAAATTTGVGSGTTEMWWGIDTAYWFLLPRPPSDPSLLTTALLENELLGGAGTAGHAWWWRPGSWPQQRAYVSDPSFYPTVAPADPLTLAWGDAGPYWHLYNRAADIGDRREYFTQRLYQSDPSLLLSALLENELLGGAETGKYYRVPATHAARWWMPQQQPRLADPLLIGTAELENELLGGAGTAQRYGFAAYCDRREVPQQRPYISDPSFYPSGAATDPLTLAWGAGGNWWHLYNRAADVTDRREVPQQRAYVSDPLLLATALLENELLGGADDLARHRAWYADRREYPAQRPGTSLPDIPADPLILGDDRGRHLLAAGYWPRGWSWFQRQFFPLPAPPPPFTAGTLTAADAPLGTLTATDQRTGGPS